jgi:D-threo-aldose 1-dehydrogenase
MPKEVSIRGRRISRLGFGGAPIGNLYETVTDGDAYAALDAALMQGIRLIDTAPFYGYGLSEERIGRVLAHRPRESYVLSTKVGRLVDRDIATTNAQLTADQFAVSGQAVFDYSRDGVLRSFEASLKRLGVSHIDILLLHDVGKLTHGARHEEMLRRALDEALPAMARLRESCAVHAIGVGVNEQDVVLEILPRFPLDCVLLAGRYTLLEQQNSAELMDYALQHDVRILAAGVYNSGLLASAKGPGERYNYDLVKPDVLQRARRLYAECALEGIDAGAAALQFPLAHPAVASVVVGLRSVTEVEVALTRARAPLPAHLWARLKQAGLMLADAMVPEQM